MAEAPFPTSDGGEDDTPWVSVSDLMSGLMIVFLCIAVLFMREREQNIAEQKIIAEEYQQVQGSLADALVEEFDRRELERWGAELAGDGLVVRFKDPRTMFTRGEDELTPGFTSILGEFFPQLVRVLRQDAFKDHIREIRIEGHTSLEWWRDLEVQKSQAYLLNMDLSQRRAFSVLSFVLRLPVTDPGMEEDLRRWMRATGLSSSQLILVEGTAIEDKERSRRVEFRVVTDAEATMRLIVAQVTGAGP